MRAGWTAAWILAVAACKPAEAMDPTPPAAPATGGVAAPMKPAAGHGYDHPNQNLVAVPSTIAANMEPVIVHQNQDGETARKLAAAGAEDPPQAERSRLSPR
jgi:hypothetical protein